MMNYISSFFPKKEKEYKAVRRSREIYDEMFKKFYIRSKPAVSGLCSEQGCSGWEFHWQNDNYIGKAYWVVCRHRKRRGLEAHKKDMIPQHIQRAEDEISIWDRHFDGPRLAQERKEREIKRQALLQSKILREEQGSSTENQCDKKQ